MNRHSVCRACTCALALLLLSGWLAGCSLLAGSRSARVTELEKGRLQVWAQPGDTLATLASDHMGSRDRAWEIARLNGIAVAKPGKPLILPVQPFWRGGTDLGGWQKVPVLAYHGFSRKRRGNLYVTATAFERQMRYLNENGYRTIGVEDLFDFMEARRPVPDKSVLITLDAGRRSILEIGAPILEKYGLTATVFIYSDFIGGKDALSWNQLRGLVQKGYSIGSQSRTHRRLDRRRDNESFRDYIAALEKEIAGSRKRIEERTGARCTALAYPYGMTNEVVIALLGKFGYRGAFTAQAGSVPFFTDPFRIPRSFVYASDSLQRFKKRLDVYSTRDLK
jgi:peptidoglycan/xylan/chitin deacetylase (PgdA/CDA1 family)